MHLCFFWLDVYTVYHSCVVRLLDPPPPKPGLKSPGLEDIAYLWVPAQGLPLSPGFGPRPLWEVRVMVGACKAFKAFRDYKT